MSYQLHDRWFEDCKGIETMCAACDELDREENRKYEAQPFVEAERSRIRELAESRKTMQPVGFQDMKGYELCIDDLLDFLKEKE